MAININVIDQLLAEHGHRLEDIAGENGLLKQLTKALVERAMQAEMTNHLGYEKHDPAGYRSGNSRNGKSHKKLTGEFGEIELETPRDREGVRAEDHRQAPDALHGLRRQDHLDVRPRHERARHRGSPEGDVRS